MLHNFNNVSAAIVNGCYELVQSPTLGTMFATSFQPPSPQPVPTGAHTVCVRTRQSIQTKMLTIYFMGNSPFVDTTTCAGSHDHLVRCSKLGRYEHHVGSPD